MKLCVSCQTSTDVLDRSIFREKKFNKDFPVCEPCRMVALIGEFTSEALRLYQRGIWRPQGCKETRREIKSIISDLKALNKLLKLYK